MTFTTMSHGSTIAGIPSPNISIDLPNLGTADSFAVLIQYSPLAISQAPEVFRCQQEPGRLRRTSHLHQSLTEMYEHGISPPKTCFFYSRRRSKHVPETLYMNQIPRQTTISGFQMVSLPNRYVYAYRRSECFHTECIAARIRERKLPRL